MASECKVRLQSSDGEIFEVDKAVAFESETIKRMIQDSGEHSVLLLPEVRGNILAKVIEYCKFHVEAAKISGGKTAVSPDDVEKWDQEFVEMDPFILFKLVPASSYLKIKKLEELVVDTAARMIPGKTPEGIRRMFNIKNDLTPEEEAQVRCQFAWAYG